ncbi:MAG TPA: hypothetical protein VKU19_19800 [Bryobacteraceae bacterium]|nr:hypothetical protein [Bryobacteraceae bacterium]
MTDWLSETIIFVSSGLLVYWLSRTLVLFRGSEVEIDNTLESDRWRLRRLITGLSSLFVPPNAFVG